MVDDTYGVRPKALDKLLLLAKVHDAKRLILFGSRARGDNWEKSDIDIAVDCPDFRSFNLDVQEKVPTLLKLDVVDIGKPVSDELLDAIEREGVVLYAKA